MKTVEARPGDRMLLQEASFGYEYRILPDGKTVREVLEAGLDGKTVREVLEVGLDYVVLRGEGDVLTSQFPAYLLSELPTDPDQSQIVGEPQRARSEPVTTSVQDVAA